MNSFEWFLLIALAVSFGVGPLIGYAVGRRAGLKAQLVRIRSQAAARRAEVNEAYLEGRRDGISQRSPRRLARLIAEEIDLIERRGRRTWSQKAEHNVAHSE